MGYKHKYKIKKSLNLKSGVVVVIASICTIFGTINLTGCSYNTHTKKQDINSMLREIYSPANVAEFEKAKKHYTNKLITEQIAERLFQLRNKELNEVDKSRVITILENKESKAEDNSYNNKVAKVKVRVSSEIGDSTLTFLFFYNSEGKIYDYQVKEQ